MKVRRSPSYIPGVLERRPGELPNRTLQGAWCPVKAYSRVMDRGVTWQRSSHMVTTIG